SRVLPRILGPPGRCRMLRHTGSCIAQSGPFPSIRTTRENAHEFPRISQVFLTWPGSYARLLSVVSSRIEGYRDNGTCDGNRRSHDTTPPAITSGDEGFPSGCDQAEKSPARLEDQGRSATAM